MEQPSEALQALAAKLWQQRKALLGDRCADAERILESLQEEEPIYLRYILATLPPSDLAEYGAAFFLKILRQALETRREFAWCAALPERLFLLHVAYPRIHDEALSDCRAIFREALAPRVRGMALTDAILEVNRWCAEQVTYRPTDERTASVWDVYCRGYGRCGEESAFTVTALRSVGIAARQVYCPWWSHCDDNHAWVEAWDGARWRYFGACEPEPELDRGWFTIAASRAMLIHTRVFLPKMEEASFLLPGLEEAELYMCHGLTYEVRTARYAETNPVTVQVLDGTGQPVSGAKVVFSVLNTGSFMPIAEKMTGPEGTVTLRLGKGNVHVCCRTEAGQQGEALLDTAAQRDFVLAPGQTVPEDFDFAAPESGRFPVPLSPRMRAIRKEQLEKAAALRAARPGIPKPVLGEKKARLFAALSEKDRAGSVDPAVLKDAEVVFSFENQMPAAVFQGAMLPHRIGNEPLRPWRKAISAAVGEEQLKAFAADPEAVWRWINQAFIQVDSHPSLVASPAVTLRLRVGNRASLAVLFCAVCRCAGVPARLAGTVPEYWKDGVYNAVNGSTDACLMLRAQGRPVTVSRMDEQTLLRTVAEGRTEKICLSTGMYRLLSTVRLPSGGQLVRGQRIKLTAGEIRSVTMAAREANIRSLLTSQPLSAFYLRAMDGSWQKSSDILCQKSLLCWLEPGREPTVHLLKELAEEGKRICCPVYFVVPDTAGFDDPVLRQAVAALPRARVWQGDFQDTAEELARRVFAEPGQMPLSLLCEGHNRCLYHCAGYNVGAAALLAELLMLRTENPGEVDSGGQCGVQ